MSSMMNIELIKLAKVGPPGGLGDRGAVALRAYGSRRHRAVIQPSDASSPGYLGIRSEAARAGAAESSTVVVVRIFVDVDADVQVPVAPNLARADALKAPA